MVMACCERCYEHYVKDYGSISKEFLDKNFGAEANLSEEVVIDDFTPLRQKRGIPDPVDVFVHYNGKKEKICTCACHVIGSCVFH